jgi:hypothetical protein
MKRAVAALALLVLSAVVLLAVPESASAGSSTDAALALGAFAVFNQIVTGQTIFHQGYAQQPATVIYQPSPTVVYQAPPPVVYAPPPVVYAPPPPVVYAPPPPPVVVYPPPPVYYYGYAQPGYYRVYRAY